MRIHVLKLEAGDRLARDSFNSFGLNVFSSGTLLDEEAIAKLNLHDIEYVDIVPRVSGRSEPVGVAGLPISVQQGFAFSDAIDGIKDLFHHAKMKGLINDKEVEASFNPLIDSLQKQKDVVSLLISLNTKDDYTYQHCVQVGMISYYIAKWLGKSHEEAIIIGKAGYLHDIGKCRIDSSILKKPGRLSQDEFREMKKHTVYGYEIIHKSLQDVPLALAALQHHERMDGKGYPMSKRGEDIHHYAKIVAVADVYSAMTAHRVYQEKRDLLIVLKELYQMSFGQLDPQTTQLFIQHMIPNFIGKSVVLSDGRSGNIIMTNPSDFFKPLVQIEDQFIDLSHQSALEIVSVTM
jgi:putative nucleotidyltransferase with HDIG domain